METIRPFDDDAGEWVAAAAIIESNPLVSINLELARVLLNGVPSVEAAMSVMSVS